LRNGGDGDRGDGGGGARGSAVCGRGLTPAARPDGSGGVTRQQPPAPPPPQEVAGQRWRASRGDAGRGDANCNDADCADAAGRPNGDAAFRRTAEVGRGLVGGCGSRPRPCSCTSRSRAWTPHGNHMITGWRHMCMHMWLKLGLRLRAASTSPSTRALRGRRFALSSSRRAIVWSPRRSALIPEPVGRKCASMRTRTHAHGCHMRWNVHVHVHVQEYAPNARGHMNHPPFFTSWRRSR